MPSYVLRLKGLDVLAPQAVGDAAAPLVIDPQMVPRNCRLEDYDKRDIPTVTLPAGTRIIAYASPDSTYAVTKRLIDAAERSLLIGIYDFSAGHVRELVLDALARGVEVSLMLDIDGAGERNFFDDLVEMGVRGVSAPSCANSAVRLFSSSHEKVIVIDGEWCLVQSGNYSKNSIPLNETEDRSAPFRTGNRDMGLAIQSGALSELFTEILEADMAAATGTAPQLLQLPPAEETFLVERAPRGPVSKFPSQEFTLTDDLVVTPVVSPDNYMSVVPALLEKARRSILIEQQYIRSSQPKIRELLDAIGRAMAAAPDLDVRIVLGKVFEASDLDKERRMLDQLEESYGLRLGEHVRYVNTDQFVHCHNKMILIDGQGALISSQNWSDSAVWKNREAGVFLEHEGIARYFTEIFEYDWKVAFQELPEFGPEVLTPQSLAGGGFVRVERADYQEV